MTASRRGATRAPGEQAPERARWEVRYAVPDGVVELGVHLSESVARAALADLLEDGATTALGTRDREAAVTALLEVRGRLLAERLAWSGLVSAPLDHELWLLAVFGLAVRELIDPGPFTPDAAYNALARHRHGAAAVVESFPTPHTVGVGIRRAGSLDPTLLRAGQGRGDRPIRSDIPAQGGSEERGDTPAQGSTGAAVPLGIAEAVLPFPAAGACGVLTGVCLGLEGLDATAVLVAAMARRVLVIPAPAGPSAGGAPASAGPSLGTAITSPG